MWLFPSACTLHLPTTRDARVLPRSPTITITWNTRKYCGNKIHQAHIPNICTLHIPSISGTLSITPVQYATEPIYIHDQTQPSDTETCDYKLCMAVKLTCLPSGKRWWWRMLWQRTPCPHCRWSCWRRGSASHGIGRSAAPLMCGAGQSVIHKCAQLLKATTSKHKQMCSFSCQILSADPKSQSQVNISLLELNLNLFISISTYSLSVFTFSLIQL